MGNADMPPPEQFDESPTPVERSTLRDVPWRWGDILIGFAPLVIECLASYVLHSAWSFSLPGWLWLALAVLTFAWMLFYPLWVSRRRGRRPAGLPRPRTLVIESLVAILGVAILTTIMTITVHVLTGVAGLARTPLPYAGFPQATNAVEVYAFIGLAVTLAPLAEEMFFRGFLYNALRGRLGRLAAALVQAAIFGIMHPFGPTYSTAIGAAGLVLAALYEWRKTLLTPVLVHALQNGLAMAVLAAGAAAYNNAPVLGINGAAESLGCRLTAVGPGSGAEAAGLRAGDLIIAVDGESVRDINEIAEIVRGKEVGDRVTVEFVRDGEVQLVDVVLKRRRE